MTETEMAKMIETFFPNGYRLDTSADGKIGIAADIRWRGGTSLLIAGRWPGASAFLFGTRTYLSFFQWLNRNSNFDGAFDFALNTLAGCSSVEELEIRMAASGLLSDSRKTLERESE